MKSARQTAAADKLLSRIDNLVRQMDAFYAESRDDGDALGLDLGSLVTLGVDRQPIHQARSHAVAMNEIARAGLAPESEGSPGSAAQRADKAEIVTKRAQLDEPSRNYQKYLDEVATGQRRRAEILGSASGTGSVAALEKQLQDLDDLPGQLVARQEERLRLVRDVFQVKEDLLRAYRQLYAPVQAFIDKHPLSPTRSEPAGVLCCHLR